MLLAKGATTRGSEGQEPLNIFIDPDFGQNF